MGRASVFYFLVASFLTLLAKVDAKDAIEHRYQYYCPAVCVPNYLYGHVITKHLCKLQQFMNDCVVEKCTAHRGKGEGYVCTSRQVSTSPPAPSPTPSSGPSLAPSVPAVQTGEPVPDITFSDLTLRTGSLSNTIEAPSTSNEVDEFFYSFNGTLSPDGVISLDDVSDLIESVTCTPVGVVRIKLNANAKVEQPVEDMYPVNSTIVINHSLFGSCNLTEPDDTDDTDITDRSPEFRDAYLIIESVSGSSSNAVLRGSPTGFFALFESADLQVIRKSAPVRMSNQNIPAVRPFSVSAVTELFSLGPLKVEAKLTAQDSGSFDFLKARWGNGELDLEYQVITDTSIAVELEAKIGISAGLFPEKTFDFVSVPIYGIPEVNLFKLLDDKIGNWSLPSLKLGVFFEVPFVISLTGETAVELGTFARGSYSFGRKKLVYFAKGPLLSLDLGVREEVNEKSSTAFSLTPPSTSELSNLPASLSVTVFSGIRPQIALYAAVLKVRLSGDVGIETKAKLAVANAFPPTSGSVFSVGNCDTCHQVEINADAVIGNVGVFGSLGLESPSVSVFGASFSFKFKKTFSLNLPGNPSLSLPLVQACYISEFGENTVLCGDEDCCDSEREQCISTKGGQLQCSPDVSPTATPEFSPIPVSPTDGATSSVYTDPHLRTFDGLSYDCQASGVFIMVMQESSGLEIQSRFEGQDTRGSVTTGLALRETGSPTIQMSVSKSNTNVSFTASECPVSFLVNGENKNLTDVFSQQGTTVSASVIGVTITLRSGVSLSFRLVKSTTFGCYLESLQTYLPRETVNSGGIVGLLGSPNNDVNDDWMTRNGTIKALPDTKNGRLFAPAYNYCTQNWCVREESESLFILTEAPGQSIYDRCDVPYEQPVNLEAAPSNLVELCGQNSACLIDGLVGGLQDASNSLIAQAEADLRSSLSSALGFFPAAIGVNIPTNILITLNTSRINQPIPSELEKYVLFRVDPVSGSPGSSPIISLEDDGNPSSSDFVKDDGVFTNILAEQSSVSGEVFGYRAVPVISGSTVEDSPLAVTILTAVRSYSTISEVDNNTNIGNNVYSVGNSEFEELELVLRYSWGEDQNDLDTGTMFLNNTVGFDCPGSNGLVGFSGDDTSAGGSEVVNVRLSTARQQGLWDITTQVIARAGWYLSGSGPATLRVFLRSIDSQEEDPQSGLSSVIIPGQQSGCATTEVAVINIVRNETQTTISLLSV